MSYSGLQINIGRATYYTRQADYIRQMAQFSTNELKLAIHSHTHMIEQLSNGVIGFRILAIIALAGTILSWHKARTCKATDSFQWESMKMSTAMFFLFSLLCSLAAGAEIKQQQFFISTAQMLLTNKV